MKSKRAKISALVMTMCLLLCAVVFVTVPAERAFATSTESDRKTEEDKDDDDKSLSEIRKELEQANADLNSLKQQLAAAQGAVSNLKDSKASVESKIKKLATEIANVQEAIDELNQQMEATQTLIATTTEALRQAEVTRQHQYESMKLRIRFMYENSSSLYLNTIFGAGGITEMLNAIEYITDLSKYDRNMLEEYMETEAQIADTKAILETEYASLEEAKQIQEENIAALEAMENQREAELKSIGQELVSAEQIAAAWEAEVKSQEEIIALIRALEAEKSAEENKSLIDDRYGFLWPCDSTRITSDYGNREEPISGAGNNHKGIDIGAPYGTNIYAAQNGIVKYARWSNSAGNWVMIDHGDSLYTVYMHASSLCVSEGQTVYRGDVVAKVGSTGQSTGNHLHFGVSKGGGYVNPWGYVSKP